MKYGTFSMSQLSQHHDLIHLSAGVLFACLYCWQDCGLPIMKRMDRSPQGDEGHGQGGHNLILKWPNPICHAVLFCCVNHDNCLIHHYDYCG